MMIRTGEKGEKEIDDDHVFGYVKMSKYVRKRILRDASLRSGQEFTA
jgi:hypothetical protein